MKNFAAASSSLLFLFCHQILQEIFKFPILSGRAFFRSFHSAAPSADFLRCVPFRQQLIHIILIVNQTILPNRPAPFAKHIAARP